MARININMSKPEAEWKARFRESLKTTVVWDEQHTKLRRGRSKSQAKKESSNKSPLSDRSNNVRADDSTQKIEFDTSSMSTSVSSAQAQQKQQSSVTRHANNSSSSASSSSTTSSLVSLSSTSSTSLREKISLLGEKIQLDTTTTNMASFAPSPTSAGETKEGDEVASFLRSQNLEEYFSKFIDEGYDSLSRLKNLKLVDLVEDIGMKKGHARQILREIASYSSESQQDTHPHAPALIPMPPPEEKVSSVITLETQIELEKLKLEVRQIEKMEENSLSSASALAANDTSQGVVSSSFALKWGKNKYEVTIDGTTSPISLMQQVEQLTGVPVKNQKIMAKKGWKGILSNDTKLKVKPGKTKLTLMGSAAKTPPSEKHNNIKKLEKEVNSAVKKFEREMNELKEKEKNALLNRDAAGEADDYDKAEEHENEMKQYQEKQVALAEEHKIKVDELKQKVNNEKKQLGRVSESFARIELKKEEYENRKKELKVEKKDGWIQEGRSLTEAVKVLNGLVDRMNNLKSVKEKVAREQKEREAAKEADAATRVAAAREERLRQEAVEAAEREAAAAREAAAREDRLRQEAVEAAERGAAAAEAEAKAAKAAMTTIPSYCCEKHGRGNVFYERTGLPQYKFYDSSNGGSGTIEQVSGGSAGESKSDSTTPVVNSPPPYASTKVSLVSLFFEVFIFSLPAKNDCGL